MRRCVIVSAIVTLMTAGAIVGVAQTRPAPAPLDEARMLAGFKITVARTDTGVSLTCEEGGCAWDKLSFSLSGKPVAVNDYGMAGSPDNAERKGKFLIRFATDSNGFALTCERGCAWRTLGWGFKPIGVAVPINEYGMAAKK